MCLYPRLIKNRKFTENKKNRGIIPPVKDPRTLYVPVGCQECIECRKQKTNQWRVRLLDDIKKHKNGKFITLTFSNESIVEIIEYIKNKYNGILLEGYDLDNEIATTAMRLFNERWRKKFKKALRHWMITELGHNGTENIHLHGIVWTNESFKTIREIWKYGFIWPRSIDEEKINYVSARTINYITKYVTKKDLKHKLYKSTILTSPGIGARYTESYECKENKYNGENTIETYRTNTGHKIGLPIYWRNKIYTDEEKEKLWLNRLDQMERWVGGERIDISKTQDEYFEILKWHRRINHQLGYGNGDKSWERAEYERQRREIQYGKRIKMANTKGNPNTASGGV